ncbi:3-deoxy-manno-octulosonate cytidylyltransferase [Natronospora cellulosivora (SeqCode)]
MEIVAIIPARYASTRFPGKPLVKIKGKPMIEHVYKRVSDIEEINKVIVATDDQRIYNAVQKFSGEVLMTSSDLNSGTDRIAEVAKDLRADIIVNVQGDEPLIKQEMVKEAINPFYTDSNALMSTLKKKIDDLSEIDNPNVVKVVTDSNNNALYFSRSRIPYNRLNKANYYKHIGLYVYNREFLMKYSQMEQTKLERIESLEQLRALENGYKIKVVETNYNSIGVDLPEDIIKVEKIIEKEKLMKGKK